MAEAPNPLREEAERQEGTAGISITARAGKSKKDEVDKVMKEKPYVAPEPEQEEEVDVMFPVKTDPEETLAEFKARMKDICLRLFVEEEYSDNARLCIADRLLEEILK
jgi:hypothetical protein